MDIKYENRTSVVNNNLQAFNHQIDGFEFNDKIRKSENYVLENKLRIDLISKDIIKHYKEVIYAKGYKALLVCSSRAECIKYSTAIRENINEFLKGKIEVNVLMSSNIYDPPEFKEYSLNNLEQHILIDRFRKPIKQDNLAILIVNDRLLTGLDSPVLKCLYIDRLLKGERLMQAIARINRPYKDYKESGYIIDYYGIDEFLQQMVNIKGHFITKININNVRHLKNIDINLSKYDKKHLILTGKNGSGKTSVLQEVRNLLQSIENNEVEHIHECKKNIEDLKRKIDKTKNNIKLSTNSKDILTLNYELDLDLYTKAYEKYCRNVTVDFNTVDLLTESYKAGKYILAYFDAKRETNIYKSKEIEKIPLISNYKMDDYPGVHFVQYLLDLKTQQSFSKNENDNETSKRIDIWFSSFKMALRDVFEDDTLELIFNSKNYDFKIKQDGREPFGFDALSDGYSSILNIITNLIMKMELSKGNYSNNSERYFIYDIGGVVIIDEIENHLHIELQKKILPFLTKLFPKVQFIVSTHSPFVLNSLDNVIVYDLENRIQVEDLSKYSYKGIIEGYFDIDQYSDKIKSKIQRYEELINKADTTEDEKIEMLSLRRYLGDIPSDLAPELVYKFNEIEFNRRGDEND